MALNVAIWLDCPTLRLYLYIHIYCKKIGQTFLLTQRSHSKNVNSEHTFYKTIDIRFFIRICAVWVQIEIRSSCRSDQCIKLNWAIFKNGKSSVANRSPICFFHIDSIYHFQNSGQTFPKVSNSEASNFLPFLGCYALKLWCRYSLPMFDPLSEVSLWILVSKSKISRWKFAFDIIKIKSFHAIIIATERFQRTILGSFFPAAISEISFIARSFLCSFIRVLFINIAPGWDNNSIFITNCRKVW